MTVKEIPFEDKTDIREYDKYDMANMFNIGFNVEDDKYVPLFHETVHFKDADQMHPGYYTAYMVLENETWPIISYKQYGTIELWWLICKANYVKEPMMNDPVPGELLKVPTQEVVDSILAELKEL